MQFSSLSATCEHENLVAVAMFNDGINLYRLIGNNQLEILTKMEAKASIYNCLWVADRLLVFATVAGVLQSNPILEFKVNHGSKLTDRRHLIPPDSGVIHLIYSCSIRNRLAIHDASGLTVYSTQTQDLISSTRAQIKLSSNHEISNLPLDSWIEASKQSTAVIIKIL